MLREMRDNLLKDLVLDVGDKVLESPEETSTFMNGFFKSKVTKLLEQLTPSVEDAVEYMEEYLEGRKVGDFSFQPISFDQTMFIIKSLKNTNSLGRDGIGVKVVKLFRDVLAPALQFIINLSIKKNIFPSRWKFGQVIPLPKKGNLREPKNWRPINLLPICSKTLEMAMNYQFKSHLESWELFSPSQHAYRDFRGTVTAWTEIDTIIREAAERGWSSIIATTDLSAAFNTLDKKIMIPMLRRIGMTEDSARLMASYLSGRKTVVKVGEATSEAIDLDTGVGEGSIQGPICFISILIPVPVVAKRTNRRLAKLGIMAKVHTVEFADDCSGIITGETEFACQIATTIMMEEFNVFYNTVGLKQNMDKSEILPVRRCKKTFDISVGDVVETDCIKLLGLTVQSGLRFERHVENMAKSVRQRIHEIYKLQHKMNFTLLKNTVESLCLSKIYYCMEIYNNTKEISVAIQ